MGRVSAPTGACRLPEAHSVLQMAARQYFTCQLPARMSRLSPPAMAAPWEPLGHYGGKA